MKFLDFFKKKSPLLEPGPETTETEICGGPKKIRKSEFEGNIERRREKFRIKNAKKMRLNYEREQRNT